jgi:LPS export ABC transporter protein LptC
MGYLMYSGNPSSLCLAGAARAAFCSLLLLALCGPVTGQEAVKSPEPVLSAGGTSAAVSVPQQIEGFNLSGYSQGGEKSWDIKGDSADVNGNKVAVSKVNANTYGQQDTNLMAEKGVIDKLTGDIYLESNVVITSQDGVRMKTDTLDWERDKDLVRTEDIVTLEDEIMKIKGTGMEARPSLKAAKLQSRVTADIKTQTRDKKGGSIQITSDGPMEIDQNTQMAVFRENVVAVEAETGRVLKADRMEVRFDEKTRRIREIVCVGHVTVEQGNNVTSSESLIYKADEQRMVLIGKPKLILDPKDNTSGDLFKF